MQSNNEKFTPQTLQFEIIEKLQFFTIIFEAVSPQRNLLKDIIFEEFHLDTIDLQRTHPLIYNRINKEMAWCANDFWKAGKISPIKEDLSTKAFDAMINESFSATSNLKR